MTLEHRIGKLEDFTMPHKIINELTCLDRAVRIAYLLDQDKKGNHMKKKTASRLFALLNRGRS